MPAIAPVESLEEEEEEEAVGDGVVVGDAVDEDEGDTVVDETWAMRVVA